MRREIVRMVEKRAAYFRVRRDAPDLDLDPAVRAAAESILTNHRAQECDAQLMPFKDIIRLIPEE